MARPLAPLANVTSASTVGFPRESRTSRACIISISVITIPFSRSELGALARVADCRLTQTPLAQNFDYSRSRLIVTRRERPEPEVQVRPDHEIVGVRRGSRRDSRHGFAYWATATLAFQYNVKLLSTLTGSGLGWMPPRQAKSACSGPDAKPGSAMPLRCQLLFCSLPLVCVAANFQVVDHE